MMLTSISLFTGLVAATIGEDSGLTEAQILRRATADAASYAASLTSSVDGTYGVQGVAPADGLVAFIMPARVDGAGTNYKRLRSTGGFESCHYDSDTPSTEHLWRLEKTYHFDGTDVETYFVQNVAHVDTRMSYFWQSESEDSGTNLYQTCGTSVTPRHEWYFQPTDDSTDDDMIHGVVNRYFGALDSCRLRAGESSPHQWLADYKDKYNYKTYVCQWGDDTRQNTYTLDAVYNLWGTRMEKIMTPDSDDWTHYRLVNPFASTAGWNTISNPNYGQSVIPVDEKFTYTYGITQSFSDTQASSSTMGTSLSMSVGGSILGMDFGSEFSMSFEQSFSSSYTSAMSSTYTQSTTISYQVPAGHCVELMQLQVTTSDYKDGQFAFLSPVRSMKVWCCNEDSTICPYEEKPDNGVIEWVDEE